MTGRNIKISEYVLLVSQSFILLFLLFHDWIPLGSLTNLEGVRAENTTGELIKMTFLNSILVIIALIIYLIFMGKRYPLMAKIYFILSYSILLIGAIFAWWIPYFFGASQEKVDRFNVMFQNTHAFLPVLNGIVPNTIHVIFHSLLVITIGTFIYLFVRKGENFPQKNRQKINL